MQGVCGYGQPGEPAVLDGYARRLVQGEVYPAITPRLDEQVAGMLYRNLSAVETRLLDAFEGEIYERLPVILRLKGQTSDAERVATVGRRVHQRHSLLRWLLGLASIGLPSRKRRSSSRSSIADW